MTQAIDLLRIETHASQADGIERRHAFIEHQERIVK
jgi:hypothetical protein